METDGTQCGFCTPGFVMSMVAMEQDDRPSNDSEIHDALAGNPAAAPVIVPLSMPAGVCWRKLTRPQACRPSFCRRDRLSGDRPDLPCSTNRR